MCLNLESSTSVQYTTVTHCNILELICFVCLFIYLFFSDLSIDAMDVSGEQQVPSVISVVIHFLSLKMLFIVA